MSNVTTLPTEQVLTQDQIELIKKTVAKDATDDELKMFLHRAKVLGFDPLKPGQIYFVKYRKDSPGSIIIGLDGFRTRAARTGKHTGTKRGVLRDEKGQCIGAWCEVFRVDWKEPAREEVSLAEYRVNYGQWQKMPETMIKKVAEVAALRMAFPDELGGVYSDDEMAQAEAQVKEVKPAPTKQQVFHPEETPAADYVPRIGKYQGKKLSSIKTEDLVAYYVELEKVDIEKFPPQGKELFEKLDQYLMELEGLKATETEPVNEPLFDDE